MATVNRTTDNSAEGDVGEWEPSFHVGGFKNGISKWSTTNHVNQCRELSKGQK